MDILKLPTLINLVFVSGSIMTYGGCCLLDCSLLFGYHFSTLENFVERSLHYLLVEFNLFWILFWLPLWVVSRNTFGPLATVFLWDTELPVSVWSAFVSADSFRLVSFPILGLHFG